MHGLAYATETLTCMLESDSPEKSVKWTIILLLIFVCICCFSMWIMMVMLKMMTNVLPDDEFV